MHYLIGQRVMHSEDGNAMPLGRIGLEGAHFQD